MAIKDKGIVRRSRMARRVAQGVGWQAKVKQEGKGNRVVSKRQGRNSGIEW